MPRNRRPQDREEKRAEIVAAAAGLFTAAGYDETSMAKVAASAGVTTNTIYWYFTDKDALLVGVLDHVLSGALEAASLHAEEPWVDQVLWAVEQLEQYNRLKESSQNAIAEIRQERKGEQSAKEHVEQQLAALRDQMEERVSQAESLRQEECRHSKKPTRSYEQHGLC